jgi:hypothetical protein
MLLPCAPLDSLLLWRVLASIVAPPLRGTRVVVVPVLPLLLLGVLLAVVLVLPLLLLGMLLLVMLRLLVTLGLLLPLLPLRLGVLRLRFLGMLLFGLASLMPTLLLFGVVLLVAVLFVLGTGRSSDSENQGQDGRAGNCDHFHMCCLRCC